MSDLEVKIQSSVPEGWDELVHASANGRLYHLSGWNRVLEKSFGHKTVYGFVRSNGRILLGLPAVLFKSMLFGKMLVSQPYANYGGLVGSGTSEAEKKLLLKYDDYLKERKLTHLEIRETKIIDEEIPVRTHKVTFWLPLPDSEDELWRRFPSKLRSQIRRPLKEGMTVRCGHLDLLNSFYLIYTKNMRDLGSPALPLHFFENLLMEFMDKTTIVCVYHGQTPVAASFLVHYKSFTEIPWASSLREFNRFSPNMLLYWESLRIAIQRRSKYFDFGRCSRDAGTYRFKKQWGGEENSLYWHYLMAKEEAVPETGPSNGKFSSAIKIWQKMPLFVTNFIGPRVIKHIPA